jgi:hypothetical protein
MEYPEAVSLRLDACEFDRLGPLLGFVGNQLSKGRNENGSSVGSALNVPPDS